MWNVSQNSRIREPEIFGERDLRPERKTNQTESPSLTPSVRKRLCGVRTFPLSFHGQKAHFAFRVNGILHIQLSGAG